MKDIQPQKKLLFVAVPLVVLSVIWFAFPASLILEGEYKNSGNIYSPEINNEYMYFSGWYNDADYPRDKIYRTSDYKNIETVISLDKQIGDPTILNNKMYYTYSMDSTDITKHRIAVSTTNNNGESWSAPQFILNNAWLPSIVQSDKVYLYYTIADGTTNQLTRAELSTYDVVTDIKTVSCTDGVNPVNVDVIYSNNKYYLAGDYWEGSVYSIGLWESNDGIIFNPLQTPIVSPHGDGIIVRTPYIEIDNDDIKIWYAQQDADWWTNSIYYNNIKGVLT